MTRRLLARVADYLNGKPYPTSYAVNPRNVTKPDEQVLVDLGIELAWSAYQHEKAGPGPSKTRWDDKRNKLREALNEVIVKQGISTGEAEEIILKDGRLNRGFRGSEFFMGDIEGCFLEEMWVLQLDEIADRTLTKSTGHNSPKASKLTLKKNLAVQGKRTFDYTYNFKLYPKAALTTCAITKRSTKDWLVEVIQHSRVIDTYVAESLNECREWIRKYEAAQRKAAA